LVLLLLIFQNLFFDGHWLMPSIILLLGNDSIAHSSTDFLRSLRLLE